MAKHAFSSKHSPTHQRPTSNIPSRRAFSVRAEDVVLDTLVLCFSERLCYLSRIMVVCSCSRLFSYGFVLAFILRLACFLLCVFLSCSSSSWRIGHFC